MPLDHLELDTVDVEGMRHARRMHCVTLIDGVGDLPDFEIPQPDRLICDVGSAGHNRVARMA